jgi:hypothetical protein
VLYVYDYYRDNAFPGADYRSPVDTLNPYQYANTYGYDLVRPSPHVPSKMSESYYRSGAFLTGGFRQYR